MRLPDDDWRKHLEGKVFGKLTVLSRVPESTNNYSKMKWLCRCECGTEKVILGNNLVRGLSTTCGCYRCTSRTPDLCGKVFGKLTVDHYVSCQGWLCQCECGREVIRKTTYLTHSKKCDCGKHRAYNIPLRKDYIGLTYDGEWTVLYRDTSYTGKKVKYICENSKGERKSVFSTFIQQHLKNKEEREKLFGVSLVGKKFGKLTVVEKADFKGKPTKSILKHYGNYEERTVYHKAKGDQWLCKCECGNHTIVTSSCLFTGHTSSCGCDKKPHKKRVLKIEKEKFVLEPNMHIGRLKILKKISGCSSRDRVWLCKCECGNKKEIKELCIRQGVKSCGCLKKKNVRFTFYKKENQEL